MAGIFCWEYTFTLQEIVRFVRIIASGINESTPHNVTITKEAPNYSR
jgi:IMP dehydrogenase